MSRSLQPAGFEDLQLEVQLQEPHLVLDLPSPHRCLSWALAGGGFHTSTSILWREVRDRDLGLDVDPTQLLQDDLAALGRPNAVGLLTSAPLSDYALGWARENDISACCVATVGLANALAIGDPPGLASTRPVIGTINIALVLSHPVTDSACIEALSLAAEARTASVLNARVKSRRSEAPASGTGTDCIVVAAPLHPQPVPYAGKHTALGSVIGVSVRAAMDLGIEKWRARQAR